MTPVWGILGMSSGWEWIVILLVIMMLFGPGKLPQVFRQFGKAVKSFKDGQKDDEEPEPAALPETPAVMEAQVVSETAAEPVPK